MEVLALRIEHVSKQYRLGTIGGGTLKGDLQSWWAHKRGQEDPNSKIGSDLSGRIGERFLALDDVSFEVKKGEAVGIIGHNGAGKSTLLKLLSRVTAPSEGKISINGRIASMLEVGTGFHPELTGRENVYMNGAILGMTRAEIDKKFDQIVEFAEMEKFIDTPVKRYSSGMYVKLAFSVAAHLDSEIMIMDEVLAVGDMAFQKKCLDKMREAAKQEGRTVLYVSHNMNTIRQLCDRCVVLDHGKIVYDGDVEEAIEVYSASIASFYEVSIDLSNKRMAHLPSQYKVKMKHILLERKKQPFYELSEGLPFSLTIETFQTIDNLCIRLEIRASDGSSVGASILQDFVSLSSNTVYTLPFFFDCAGLVAGKYSALLVLYCVNEWGTYEDLDAVFPAFNFVVQDNTGKTEIKWNANHWGRIRFKDLHYGEHA